MKELIGEEQTGFGNGCSDVTFTLQKTVNKSFKDRWNEHEFQKKEIILPVTHFKT